MQRKKNYKTIYKVLHGNISTYMLSVKMLAANKYVEYKNCIGNKTLMRVNIYVTCYLRFAFMFSVKNLLSSFKVVNVYVLIKQILTFHFYFAEIKRLRISRKK